MTFQKFLKSLIVIMYMFGYIISTISLFIGAYIGRQIGQWLFNGQ